MKTRHLALFVGFMLLVAAGTAMAHDSYRYPAPDPQVHGGISIWGGSAGIAGWTGALRIGTPLVAVPAYGPAIVVPRGHHHGPRCHHGPRHAPRHGHGKAYRKGYAKGRRDAHRHGYYD